jgi:choline dehydrogenase-like flavoprotein
VHGARGEDPTDPPASASYPYPAVSHEPRIQQLSDDLAAAGFHPFHAPCGILVNEANLPYSICVRCADCDGFPCPLHAKSDAEVLGVRPALEHDNVTLVRNARVVKLETNPAGTAVTQVVVEHDGETEQYEGDIVVVSCGAVNSAKLLLASASDKHPNGLANGSDQVGRNFMYHDSQAVLALSKDPNPTVFQKTLGVNDFYFRGPDFDYPMGNIQMIGKSQAAMFRGATSRRTPWTSGCPPRICRSQRTGSPSARTAPCTWRTRRATPRPPSGCTTSSIRCSARSGCTPATWLTGSRT